MKGQIIFLNAITWYYKNVNNLQVNKVTLITIKFGSYYLEWDKFIKISLLKKKYQLRMIEEKLEKTHAVGRGNGRADPSEIQTY